MDVFLSSTEGSDHSEEALPVRDTFNKCKFHVYNHCIQSPTLPVKLIGILGLKLHGVYFIKKKKKLMLYQTYILTVRGIEAVDLVIQP